MRTQTHTHAWEHAGTHTKQKHMLVDVCIIKTWIHGGYKHWCRHEISRNRPIPSGGNNRLCSSFTSLHKPVPVYLDYVNGNLKRKWWHLSFRCGSLCKTFSSFFEFLILIRCPPRFKEKNLLNTFHLCKKKRGTDG